MKICSQNDYQFITNFEWYISVLVELTRMEGTSHGPLVASQMMDVSIRVESVRAFAVSQMSLLVSKHFTIARSLNFEEVTKIVNRYIDVVVYTYRERFDEIFSWKTITCSSVRPARERIPQPRFSTRRPGYAGSSQRT